LSSGFWVEIKKIMAKFKRFEEIECWKKARELSKMIYAETGKFDFSKDFTLTKQIRSSSGSIMDNIAEGFERGGNKEFIQFLYISKGSAAETKSQLYRAFDQNYISENSFQQLYVKTDEISYMIGKLISYLKSADFKGVKYK
jgi:four helix bundle protein